MGETKYGKYLMTKCLEPKEAGRPGVSPFFLKAESAEDSGRVNLSIIGGYITEPYTMEPGSMVHDFDQCLLLIGANPDDMSEFDAEVELCLGEEREKHIINSATIVHIPAGLVHCPLNIAKVNKPILFMDISIVGKYYKKAV
jgi:hypothetical protein